MQIVGTTNPGDSLTVPGEGVWSVDGTTGEITFTPEPGFTNDPTDIAYTIDDDEGNTSNPAAPLRSTTPHSRRSRLTTRASPTRPAPSP